ncbi:ABC transporter transmembrane domain-containing protein, partial [Acinetobacter baumannii]
IGASTLFAAFIPLLFAQAVDAYAGRPLPWLAVPILVLVAYSTAAWVGRLLGQLYLLAYGPIEQRVVRRLSRSLYDHLHGLSLRFHLGRQTGSLA